MTMFSMKPKFNLEEFLATPASPGAVRHRSARSRAMKVETEEAPEAATGPALEDPAASD
jgi:hypothetical protein